jgi:hypothetical protein
MADAAVELREHHFGPIGQVDVSSDTYAVDAGALIRRLLLFERCTVESNQLREIPALVSTFGFKGLMLLLESGAIDILGGAMTAGQIGQTDIQATRNRGYPLPPGSYRLGAVLIPLDDNGGENLHRMLQEVHQASISLKQAIKLKKLLASMIQTYPFAAGNAGVEETQRELIAQSPVVWSAIRRLAGGEHGIDLGDVPKITCDDLGNDGDFRIDTPLTERLGADAAHKLIERAILGVAGTNVRICLMRELQGVTGFQDSEFPFFEDKIGFLMRDLDPDVQEERFERIVEIAGLPSLAGSPAATTVDAGRLLKLRETDECRELRAWLRTVDKETDAEINARFESLRGRLADLVNSGPARAIRFAIPVGASFIPGAGGILGPAASAVDSFLVEKIVGKPGPATFLSKHYPSIFQSPPQ